MCAAVGAGPMPIPQRELTTETLSQAIRYCLSAEAAHAAAKIAHKMEAEVGVAAAAQSFHQNLPTKRMTCDLIPHLSASFRFKKGKHDIKLSSLAAKLVLQVDPKITKHLEL